MNVREKRLYNDFKALSELIDNSGVFCLGPWSEMAETLPELVLRIGKVIQYVDDIIYKAGYDNHQAWEWYQNNRDQLPVDNKTFKSLPKNSGIIWNDISAVNSNIKNIVALNLEGS
jgi:hypothetical protein